MELPVGHEGCNDTTGIQAEFKHRRVTFVCLKGILGYVKQMLRVIRWWFEHFFNMFSKDLSIDVLNMLWYSF